MWTRLNTKSPWRFFAWWLWDDLHRISSLRLKKGKNAARVEDVVSVHKCKLKLINHHVCALYLWRTEALFTRADIQPDTDIQKYRPNIILHWRIEYQAKWVLHPFFLTKASSPLTQCYNNIGPIFLNIGVELNIGTCEQGLILSYK